jgi:hypothetical protein
VSNDVLAQIEDAYRQMATSARYRPEAPSDGMGNVTVPEDQLDLDGEARDYAARYLDEEKRGAFRVGFPNFPDRPALIWIIEAARLVNGGDPARARELLGMADAALAQSKTNLRF